MISKTTTSSVSKAILLLSLVVLPCSCAYITATSHGRKTSLYDMMLSPLVLKSVLVWIVFEIMFYLYFLRTKKRLQQTTKPKKSLNKSERTNLFWNCVHTIPDLTSWSEGWFYYKKDYSHPSFKDIHRENLALWFAWAFWNDHVDVVRQNKEWADEIEWMLSSAEQWFHVTFPQGLNPNLECIRLNLDPVQAFHRPLVVYLAMYIITAIFNLVCLQTWGFQHSGATAPGIVWGGPIGFLHHALQSFLTPRNINKNGKEQEQPRLRHLSYYYRPSAGQKTPLVFIHGIGAGILCYAEFVYQLVTHLDRPMFLVELPYVAMHMVDCVPTAAETVAELQEMLQSFGYDRAVYVSHSLGTGVTSWLMNMAPNSVAGLVLIDPICFLLHYHNVAFNFVHRIPKTIFEYIMHYGAARELYISYYISRHFQWYESIYFCQLDDVSTKLLENTSIFLSEKDGIVGSANVHHYLSKRGVNVHMMEGLEHAMFLTNHDWKNKISKQIDIISRKADCLVN